MDDMSFVMVFIGGFGLGCLFMDVITRSGKKPAKTAKRQQPAQQQPVIIVQQPAQQQQPVNNQPPAQIIYGTQQQ